MKEENIKIVESYLNALRKKDLSLCAAFADDLEFADPIAGKAAGAENLRAFLAGFLPAINDLQIYDYVCEGEYVVAHFAVDTVFGIIPILEKFRVRNGKISELFGFYDPRPIIGG